MSGIEKGFIFMAVLNVIFIATIVAILISALSKPRTRVTGVEIGIVIEKSAEKDNFVAVETDTQTHYSHGDKEFFDSVELGDEIVFVTKVTERRFHKPREATYFYTMEEYAERFKNIGGERNGKP